MKQKWTDVVWPNIHFKLQLFPEMVWTATTACLYPLSADYTSYYHVATENTRKTKSGNEHENSSRRMKIRYTLEIHSCCKQSHLDNHEQSGQAVYTCCTNNLAWKMRKPFFKTKQDYFLKQNLNTSLWTTYALHLIL